MTGPRRVRRYFFTGLVVLAPLGVTAAILVWLFNALDAIFGTPLQRLLGVRIPGLGLVLLLLAVLVIGWLANYAMGRQFINWWHGVLGRFPVIGRIYSAASQIAQTLVAGKRRVFLRTVLIEFPTPGTYAIAWVTAEDNPFAEAILGEPCVNVFLATTPNPTSGYLLIVPKSRTQPLDFSIEEGMKLVISAGAVLPSGAGSSPGALDLSPLLAKPGQ